jgi:hypothetical protein
MVTRCFNGKVMEENSAYALDRTLSEASEKTRDWTQFLPIEPIKMGLTEIALGLPVFVTLVAFSCFH